MKDIRNIFLPALSQFINELCERRRKNIVEIKKYEGYLSDCRKNDRDPDYTLKVIWHLEGQNQLIGEILGDLFTWQSEEKRRTKKRPR